MKLMPKITQIHYTRIVDKLKVFQLNDLSAYMGYLIVLSFSVKSQRKSVALFA